MLEELGHFWNADLSWDALIVFCAQMTELRTEIRWKRGIRDFTMYCRSCKARHAMKLPDISPRSALFALQKIGRISATELKTLDREWKKHRKQNQLDVCGKPKRIPTSETTACSEETVGHNP